ncbi:phage tail tape measure protein [Pseudomonas sp. RIT-PI-S]|uniref:phage tail tape measure protein n=1 Tax=Pseudomonas sp. RIT-PI-S TaxID=3035295 RepID=UPI0021D958C8|nr:phage tail tape measure protein [Pseudomonas sp. RIT-PI-S]
MGRDLRVQVVLRALDRATRPLRSIDGQAKRVGRAMRGAHSQLQALNNSQRQIGQFRELRQGLDSTRTALGNAAQRTQALGRQFSATTQPTRALRREFEQAKRTLGSLKQKEVGQTLQLQQMRQTLRATGIDTQQLTTHERRLATQVRETTQRLEAQRAELRRLGQQQHASAQARSRLENTRGLAATMAGQGAASAAAGGTALYAGARMIQPGLEFDASQSKVQALTRLDKNAEAMKALRSQARHLGATTQFTATDASDGQGYLAMAGYTPQAIQQALPGVLDLAKAGDTGLAETADIASNILSGFKLKASQTGQVGDVLVGTFTRSNTDLRMLGETMKYVAPVAAGLGQDIETVAAMTGKLGNEAIQGSMAGTALRSILSRLAGPPKEAQKALAKLNITTRDANGNLRSMPILLEEIHRSSKNLGNTERTQLFKAIAGQESFGALQVLATQAGSGELQAFIGLLRDAKGEALNTSKVMADNLRGDLDALGSAWADLGIQLEEQQDGPLRSLAQSLTGLVGSVKAWVAEHPRLASQLTKAAAAVSVLMLGMGALTLAMAALLGPFALARFAMTLLGIKSLGLISGLKLLAGPVLGTLATGIRTASMALWGLAANPAVLAIGATVALLGGAAYLLWRNWSSVEGFFTDMWGRVKTSFSNGLASITGRLATFSPMGMLHRALSTTLKQLGSTLPTRFRELGGMLIGGLADGLRSAMAEAKQAVASLGDNLIGGFKAKLGIHSPSRVFAELGGFTMAGLSEGIASKKALPLTAITDISESLGRAGRFDLRANLAPLPRIDNRGPLRPAAVRASAPSGDVITINIQSSPGLDPQAIARAVGAELDRRERAKGVRGRSALYDNDQE